ncbi:sodium channel subunit beta-3 isoform X1 [Nycticebus coucang]|uniref:sodium channel subunit beta-3 isoform X1 n=1 Tax=Nycticebus coucang TaxID=9470 RepID=UPI00234CDF7F|nr:sodium channel subunit beta-3 isoform X1 [Nycticebus coucang]XP_053450863.1 sodium channel subunit beta-3 isoform X1 [Nycticebus coucang]
MPDFSYNLAQSKRPMACASEVAALCSSAMVSVLDPLPQGLAQTPPRTPVNTSLESPVVRPGFSSVFITNETDSWSLHLALSPAAPDTSCPSSVLAFHLPPILSCSLFPLLVSCMFLPPVCSASFHLFFFFVKLLATPCCPETPYLFIPPHIPGLPGTCPLPSCPCSFSLPCPRPGSPALCPLLAHPLLLLYLQIYEYRNGHQEVESPFQGRLQWNGSKDLQDVSITVLNVTLNDSGLYTCNVSREFEFEAHRPFVKTTRLIPLRVTEEAGEDFTSVVSEIMMYILLVFLTLWLLIEMIYCYRKVSKAEEAAQENASDYLAIPSENKENSAVPVEE